MGSLILEIRYAFRDRVVLASLVLAVVMASYAVFTGKLEVDEQRSEIETLVQETESDQRHVLSQQPDAGGAAYYVRHVTYHPPSELAFSALGSRGELPWQHRLSMLALEGQIYETDTGNPELSRLGRLDFAFLTSVLLPLILILLLYDLDGRERRDGRYELLSATSASERNPLFVRAGARTLLLFAFSIMPFAVVALAVNAPLRQSLTVMLVVGLHLLFWLVICRLVAARFAQASTSATLLLAGWLLFTIVVPAAARIVVESSVPVPAGGEILLAQREAVNDAWDLPKADTMEPFVTAHPEWRDYAQVSQPFEWKWYYAFQQMGDEFVASESAALQAGIARRDELMGFAALLSPPLAAERWLTHLAATDRAHHQGYVRCVRAFHATLREFHYPMLFGLTDYSPAAMVDLPRYQPCDD